MAAQLAKQRYGAGYNKGDIPLRDAKGQLTGFYDGYGPTSQDVLIGAFNRTYASSKHDGLIPGIWAMRPNWRVVYTGLIDFAFMKKYSNRSVSTTIISVNTISARLPLI